jgi:hypothetical protein
VKAIARHICVKIIKSAKRCDHYDHTQCSAPRRNRSSSHRAFIENPFVTYLVASRH